MRWFTLGGIKEEVRKIEWPKRKDMVRDTIVVLSFIAFFAVFFILTEFAISSFLRVVGVF